MSARQKSHILCDLDARLDELCPVAEADLTLIKALTAVTLYYRGGATVVLDADQASKDVGLRVDRLIAGLQEAKKREWLAEVVWSPVQQAIRVSLTPEDG